MVDYSFLSKLKGKTLISYNQSWLHLSKDAKKNFTWLQTIFLPVVGLVDPDKLKPGDLVGVNKDSYLILDTLPSEYDSRVKAMEVDEKPTEDYNDIGGLEKQASLWFFVCSWREFFIGYFSLSKFGTLNSNLVLLQQIQELVEAIVLPMTHKERFQKLGIRPPKGVLLYGPPGTGKTLMARACAAQTNATFLKLAGPQLVQVWHAPISSSYRLLNCSIQAIDF